MTANRRIVNTQGFTLSGRWASLKHALWGLCHLVRHEKNAWIHLAATIGVGGAAIGLGVSMADWRWLIVSIGSVWCAEALNTGVEKACDAITGEASDNVRIAKDAAAGGVLVISVAAALIGVFTLVPYVTQ